MHLSITIIGIYFFTRTLNSPFIQRGLETNGKGLTNQTSTYV